jgi:hypothetical protein
MIASTPLLAAWEWPPFINNEDIMAPVAAAAGIALVSLVLGIVWIAKLLIRHRERMAMIERGIHPDRRRESKEAFQEPAPGNE